MEHRSAGNRRIRVIIRTSTPQNIARQGIECMNTPHQDPRKRGGAKTSGKLAGRPGFDNNCPCEPPLTIESPNGRNQSQNREHKPSRSGCPQRVAPIATTGNDRARLATRKRECPFKLKTWDILPSANERVSAGTKRVES